MVQWIEQLNSKIAEMLADNKRVKFKTHSIRKEFTSKLKSLIETSIVENTTNKGSPNNFEDIVTTIMPKKTATYEAIMDASKSAKGDEHRAEFKSKQKAMI